MSDLARLAWPKTRVVEAIEALAKAARLPTTNLTEIAPTWGAGELDAEAFDRWLDAGAAWLGLDAEPIDVEHFEVDALLVRAAPALVRSPSDGSIFAIVGRERFGRALRVLTPEHTIESAPVAALRDVVCGPAEAPVARSVEGWLSGLVDDPKQRARARAAIAREILEKQTITRAWLLRLPPRASFWAQLRAGGIAGRIALVVGAHFLQYALSIYAWYALGSGAFSGSIERDWLVLWGLLTVSAIPVALLTSWTQGRMLQDAAALLKRRLLVGTLRVDLDLLRRAGAGQMWGRAMDAGALEGLALSGGLFAVLSVIELVILCGVMASGPGGALQTIVFLLWAFATLTLAWRAYRTTRRLTDARRDMTSDLIEQMVGHRTRLAQLAPERWHDGEDETIERYFSLGSAVDRKGAAVGAMSQAWLLVGLASIIPVLLRAGASAGGVAVAIGSVILGGAALARLTSGFAQIGSALTAWEQVKPLYVAAGRADALPSPEVVASQLARKEDDPARDEARLDAPVLDAADLTFSYPGRPQPVLRGGTLELRAGDRVLLEGPSGGGKSTFAAMLSGARRPDAGLLLLEGLDWQTVGPAEWRRRVAAAPQYHENHILSETFLFNLLMGRAWPPSPRDIADAQQVCEELGLGDLLARMPAGIMQMLGETGWRLSHGERSRVFIARTLLQGAKVVILDETFAALDPKTVEQCLRCVLRRAPSLVVIAHP